jgi:hypothetical protein
MMAPMGMRTAYAGTIGVWYCQAFVQSSDDVPLPEEAFAGQANGLCGAAVPGALFLTVVPNHVDVHVTVEVHDAVPPFGEEWEDIVEVSYAPATADVRLTEWGGCGEPRPLGLTPGDWRARWCAAGMDASWAGSGGGERYLLQFWPAPPAIDRVVRQTTKQAAYWHQVARDRPPPAPRPPEDERLRRGRRRPRRGDRGSRPGSPGSTPTSPARSPRPRQTSGGQSPCGRRTGRVRSPASRGSTGSPPGSAPSTRASRCRRRSTTCPTRSLGCTAPTRRGT